MHRMRTHSLNDDEVMSGLSHNSFVHNSTVNSDAESTGSVSVRDMIRRYNSAASTNGNTISSRSSININPPISDRPKNVLKHQSHHILPMNKSHSSYNITSYGSQTNLRGSNTIIDEEERTAMLNCCKDCRECACCQNRYRNLASSSKTTQNKPLGGETVKHIGPSSAQYSSNSDLLNKTEQSSRFNHLFEKQRSAMDNSDEYAVQPMESSYQSKTTITKTATGVRIIIDIFFDQEQCALFSNCDVIGSRVETNIPHSRILNEFQRQTLIGSGLVSGVVTNSSSGAFNYGQN